MVRLGDYSEPEVQACLSVLMEVMAVLGEFRENIVIVGGSVPPLLIPSAKDKHPGTLDIDLAIDYKKISDDTYKTIIEALKSRGYYQKEGEQPHVFRRDIKRSEIANEITVRIDLLAGEYGGTGKGHRHQKVQDAQARKARGCDLVFDHYVRIRLKGTLPNGAVNEVTVKIPSIGAFLVTKGMALWDRISEKDAFDVYYCCRYYPGGLAAVAKDVKSIVDNKLAREGLGKIRAKFMDINAMGPTGVADFQMVTDLEERTRIQREAFELVNGLMDKLGIEPFSQ